MWLCRHLAFTLGGARQPAGSGTAATLAGSSPEVVRDLDRDYLRVFLLGFRSTNLCLVQKIANMNCIFLMFYTV